MLIMFIIKLPYLLRKEDDLLNLNQLTYLAHLQQSGSLAKTADHFFTSHQVIRNAIIGLEEELNVTLVFSSNRGTKLTPAGQCAASYAQRTIDGLHELQEQLKNYQPTLTKNQTLHLHIVPSMATEYYFDLFDSYVAQNASVKLEFKISPFQQMLQEITDFDHVVCLTMSLPQKALLNKLKQEITQYPLQMIQLIELSNFICTHKSTKYAQLKNCSFDDLADTSIFTFLNSNPYCIDDECLTNNLSNLRYFGDYASLKRILKKKQGVALLKNHEFDYYFGKNSDDFVQIPLDNDYNVCIIAAVPIESSPLVRDFLSFLRRTL